MIQSATKQTLTPETIRALAAEVRQVPLADSCELGNGYYNTAVRLDYADGASAVLKIAPPPTTRVLRQEVDLLQTEVDTLRYVADHTSLPVPRVLAHVPHSAHIASPYMAMECVGGVSLDTRLREFSPEQRFDIYRALGGMTAELHTLTMPYFGSPALRADSWSAAFLGMVRDVLLDGSDIGAELSVPAEEIQRVSDGMAAVLNEVQVATLLHRDLWFGNIFVDETTLEILGIIDWERSVAGDPLMEFVCALLEGVYAFDGRAGFYAGYGRSETFAPSERIRLDLYSMYLTLLLIVEGYYRNYRDPRQEEHLGRELIRVVGSLRERLP